MVEWYLGYSPVFCVCPICNICIPKITFFCLGIPRETSELYLDVNEITAIDTNRLKHLKSLSRL